MAQSRASRRHSPFAQVVFQPTAVADAVRRLALGALMVAPVLAAPAMAQTAADSTDSSALPTVTVSGKVEAKDAPYAGGQVARGGNLGVLGTQDVMDTPFSTVNYTAELMQNQQARSVADVVENDASVRSTNAAGGFGDSYLIRGLAVSVNDTAFNGLYGLVSLGRMPVSMLERVEVLKGPSTFMYGMGPSGSVGGGINLVSKRAGADDVSSVTATFLGNSQYGAQLDLGRRWGQDKEWGIRVNAAYADGNTGIKDSNQQQSSASVALDYTGRKLRWNLDAYTLHEDSKNFRPQFSIGTTVMPDAPSGNTNIFPGSTLQLDDKVVATRLEYDLTDNLTAYGAIGYHVASSAQNFPSATVNSLAGDTSVYSAYYDQKLTTTSTDVGVRGRFATFGIGHTVTASVSSIDQQTDYFYGGGGSGSTNLYSPTALVDAGVARTNPTPQSQARLTSVALTDMLSMFDGRLLVTGGVRRQQVYQHSFSDASTDSNLRAWSPLLGIVVKASDLLSFYGNYTTGLSPGGTVSVGYGYANEGALLAPYKSTQYEAGVKMDWGRVMTSAAVFEINKANGVEDPVTTVYSQDGRQRIRGLELNATGEAVRGLRLMAGATFYDPKQFHTAGGTDDGKTVNGVPRHSYSLGADWDTPWLSGLSLNSRVINTGAMYYDSANSMRVPGWTRVDLGARYVTRMGGKTITYRAGINNLFDRHYWILQGTYAGLGAARTFVASAQFDF